MPSMGHLKIKGGSASDTWNKRGNDIFFLDFDYNVWEHFEGEGNITCPRCLKTMHFNLGFLIKNKRQYLLWSTKLDFQETQVVQDLICYKVYDYQKNL